NRQRLKDVLENLPEENVAYVMKCRCVEDPVTRAATVVDHIRLFRNDPRIHWTYRVHEQILPAVRDTQGDVRSADVVIDHIGYADPELRNRKLHRDLRLLKIQRQELGDEPFTLFNMGQVYQELDRPQMALELFQLSLKKSHVRDSIVRKLYVLLAHCLVRL